MNPSGQLRVGRERRGHRVVLAPGEDPHERVGVEGGRRRGHRLGDLEPRRVDLDGHAGGPGDVAQVGHEPVADVDHRRGATGRGREGRGVGRLRAPLGVHEGPRGAEPAGEDRQARCGPAQPPGDRHDVPRLGTRAQDRVRADHLPDGRHRDDDAVAAHEVTAHDRRPLGLGLGTHAGVEVGDPVDRQVRGQPEGDDQRGRPCAHDRHIDQVLRRGLGPDVGTGRPVATEVPALDEHVGGDHDPTAARPRPPPRHRRSPRGLPPRSVRPGQRRSA